MDVLCKTIYVRNIILFLFLYALSSIKCLASLASNSLFSIFSPKQIFYTLQHRINAMDYPTVSG